jgi:hypothetical protein
VLGDVGPGRDVAGRALLETLPQEARGEPGRQRPRDLQPGLPQHPAGPLPEAAVDRRRIRVRVDRHGQLVDLVAVADPEEALARLDLVLAVGRQLERAEPIAGRRRGDVLLVVEAAEAGPHAEALPLAEQIAGDEARAPGDSEAALEVRHRVEADRAGVVEEDVLGPRSQLVAVVGPERAANRGVHHLERDAGEEEQAAPDQAPAISRRLGPRHAVGAVGQRGAGHRAAGRLRLDRRSGRLELGDGVGRELRGPDRPLRVDGDKKTGRGDGRFVGAGRLVPVRVTGDQEQQHSGDATRVKLDHTHRLDDLHPSKPWTTAV